MPRPRREVCAATAAKLARIAAGPSPVRAVVGFDGFVDEIIAVVDRRHSDGRVDPVRTIAAMSGKILAAAGESGNYELIVKRRKLGGNGPIMANALACLGLDVTFVGSLGYPDVEPVFAEFAARARVLSIAGPGNTDALEFDDGKLMLGKYESLGEVHWENLLARVGREKLAALFGEATLIGMVNWTMLPRLSEIWEKLLEEVFPALPPAPRTVFLDLADPEKRIREDLRRALALASRFQTFADVILGLNLKEATQVAAVLGLPAPADPEASIGAIAAAIREALAVGCVVIHPRKAAAAATATEVAHFPGPFVQHPAISTGAGDHFNAGFCLGRISGLSLEESLCVGVSTSGFYVRSAQSPTLAELTAFAAELPPPEA